ncbi:MAG: HAMP domain-containing histidine kinase [Deltaproteobacteria bacterium]|nr:HAMP domain-containing histidine kinase [Deltaproteobacteria bacterium]
MNTERIEMPLHILYLEDSPQDVELVEATLAAEGIACDLQWVETQPRFQQALEQPELQLILSDYALPGFDGLSALRLARVQRPELPFLFVSGAIGEERAIESLQQGATDYVLKHRLARLGPAVRRALQEAAERRARRQAQAALEASLAELLRVNRTKDEFLGVMSHELRTPLSVILGYTELILTKKFGPIENSQETALRTVVQNTRQLIDMVDSILNATQLLTGQSRLEVTTVHVAGVMRELATEMQEVWDKPGIDVQWQIASSLPPLHTDRVKLKVVFKNIIGNAVKFTDQGTVCITVCPDNGGMSISVRDTGIGIARELRPVIFEMFRQGDGSMTRRYGGAGLGLYIVQALVTLMGGTITVTSAPNQSSTFAIWLPLQHAVTTHEGGR